MILIFDFHLIISIASPLPLQSDQRNSSICWLEREGSKEGRDQTRSRYSCDGDEVGRGDTFQLMRW